MYGSEMHMASKIVVSSSLKMLIVGPGLAPTFAGRMLIWCPNIQPGTELPPFSYWVLAVLPPYVSGWLTFDS
jgi:hypothetical protein